MKKILRKKIVDDENFASSFNESKIFNNILNKLEINCIYDINIESAISIDSSSCSSVEDNYLFEEICLIIEDDVKENLNNNNLKDKKTRMYV